ncbi:amino acid transporter [Aspergillus brunneoviolaceus CBS 621.78]|uniref:Amino acid transporter n=1 Tax=Aspergillus brunneoviolaceus CBS 621.78 TaxID=1450534 RepID=A0ACD1FU20_9EURO|nr:amino acid transporter [Aspergillus brunneoviolaceus CBS 621.78]RAH40496.1 amino acid transporter [Aspergillus brunneoviolaceus CBS 621.78]
MAIIRGTPQKLKQELYGFQIFFITLSVVIGSGIFVNNGSAFGISGPLGLLVATLIMSVVVLSVNACVAEFSQRFPIQNAIVEYVRTFVDDDLGWVIGLAYWYAYAASFATQNSMAGALLEYWGLPTIWRALISYALAPLVLLLLNLTGVFWYGIVETIGGLLKLIMIVSISIYLYVVAGHEGEVSDAYSLGFYADMGFNNPGHAACFAIPITAYAFQGIELYAMAAFEARDAHAIRWPSRWITYVVVVVYIMCTVGEILTVKWNNPELPRLHDGTSESRNSTSRTNSMIILAALGREHKSVAGFLNGCLLFSAFSAANTSLYVASRTLYGMASSIPGNLWIARKLRTLSPGTQVPIVALLVTAFAFCWVPFLNINDGFVVQVVSTSSSNAIMIVWAAICLAFLRYYHWIKTHDRELEQAGRPEFRRDAKEQLSGGLLHSLQPVQAWIGLIGCLVIFAFSSATWWGSSATVTEVAMAYGAHLVLFVSLVILKVCRGRKRWFRKTPVADQLLMDLNNLRVRKLNKREQTTWERFKGVLRRLLSLGASSAQRVPELPELPDQPVSQYNLISPPNGVVNLQASAPVSHPRESSDT